MNKKSQPIVKSGRTIEAGVSIIYWIIVFYIFLLDLILLTKLIKSFLAKIYKNQC